MSARTTALWVACAAALGTLLRLHFLRVPLTTDEAGYAEVARLWSRGYRLYGDTAWVDRPQGLLGLYRLAIGASESTAAIRTLAIAAGLIATVAVAVIAWSLAGRLAAVAAAFAEAVLAPAPHLEGFTANGELLAGAVAASAIAASCLWLARRDRWWLLCGAGALAGCAPFIKQSAFDGVVVVGVVVGAAAWRSGGARGAVRALGLAAAGLALPVVLVLLHSWSVGIGDWWYAIVGFRSSSESVLSGGYAARAGLFAESLPRLAQDALPLFVLGCAGLVASIRARRGLLPVCWLAACFAGFVAGGLFHPHYWVQLLPPLATLSGVAIAWIPTAGRRGALVAAAGAAACLVVIAGSAEVYWTQSPTAVSLLTSRGRGGSDQRLVTAPAVGRFIRDHTRPADRIEVIWADAGIPWYADRASATKLLWYNNVQTIPGGVQRVRDALAGPDPPAAVVIRQAPSELDPSGAIERTLAQRYRLAATIAGTPIYLLRPTA